MSVLSLGVIGANGDVVDFAPGGRPFRLARNFGLLGVPPVELASVSSPGLVSGSLRGKPRRQPKPIVVRVLVLADTPQRLYESLERLATAVDPVTPGSSAGRDSRLVVTRPDGTIRQLSARYSSGLETWPVITTGQTEVEVEILFRADDPHWTDLTLVGEVVNFPVTSTGDQDTPFDDPATAFDEAGTPFDGFRATAEEGTAVATLTNAGNAETWPIWTITGAATSVEVSNRTTGAVWRWEGNVAGTSELTVDTNDRFPSARLNGANAWSGLAVGAKNLFPLIAGPNNIVVTVLGADTNTTLSCTWLPRWLSA